MRDDITQLLIEFKDGSRKAYNQLFPLVYNRLKQIAGRELAREDKGHTYSQTDLVHEGYFRLINQNKVKWQDRAHFYAIAAKSMRRILIDHARKKRAQKRGGDKRAQTFIDEIMNIDKQAEELINIDEALDRLAALDERMAKVVEFRYFGEMTFEDIAEVMDLSARTIKRDWAQARGWLYKELRG
ncbi:sigma-70 family RNA polymerase sigma factor [Fodinibius salsisoli]|uniref:Sigma-70 family RNA polymerase sigma factor n=1 Tax=Fodinibius salsisoli TaxID=2820877 RepID=A0ABT3PQW4_9BACT|nr:sigma-70 family RNA polymerase sigma factor [Fodinibius salsisoli]MCW9708248.1 sigma-70 family RNA polymerase sigma factor [Fodinibius salsisoli]